MTVIAAPHWRKQGERKLTGDHGVLDSCHVSANRHDSPQALADQSSLAFPLTSRVDVARKEVLRAANFMERQCEQRAATCATLFDSRRLFSRLSLAAPKASYLFPPGRRVQSHTEEHSAVLLADMRHTPLDLSRKSSQSLFFTTEQTKRP